MTIRALIALSCVVAACGCTAHTPQKTTTESSPAGPADGKEIVSLTLPGSCSDLHMDAARAKEQAALLGTSCDKNDAESCYRLAVLYFCGIGVIDDRPRAVDLAARACASGSIDACNEAGLMCLQGVVPGKPDGRRALSFLQPACDEGSVSACSNLGMLYRVGSSGVFRDDGRAQELFDKACNGNNIPACVNLGLMYARGEGVTRDVHKAETLFKKACDSGNVPACSIGQEELLSNGAPPTDSVATHFDAGDTALEHGDLATAEREFRIVIERFRFSKKAPVAEIRLGDIAARRGDKAEAARIYRQWLVEHPKSVDLEPGVRSKLDAMVNGEGAVPR